MDDALVVGRADDCTVVLDDPYVAPRHCRFYQDQGLVFVEDLGSTNGTWLNGTRIDAPAVVFQGDRVQVGRTVLPIPDAATERAAPVYIAEPGTPAPEPMQGFTTSPGWTEVGTTSDRPPGVRGRIR